MVMRLLVQMVASSVVMAGLLFGAAGTLHWAGAWWFLLEWAVLGTWIGLWLAQHQRSLWIEWLGCQLGQTHRLERWGPSRQ